MSSSFLLYGNANSGHSYKVRLMLLLASIQHGYRTVDLSLPREERPEPFRSMSKFGEVPLLVHNGIALVQSNAILLHLAETLRIYGGQTPLQLTHAREWLCWEANRIGFSAPNLRFGRCFSPESFPAGSLEWLQQRFDQDVMVLEHELQDGRPFMLGDAISIADISLCAYLYWAEQAQLQLPANVVTWLNRISRQPRWRHPDDCMAR